MPSYDVIVLGVGGVGSAAMFHGALRGARVLGIDRFAPGHDRGSSHGQTRLIRQAYFEHPNYVPMVQRAFELWRELEERSKRRLYHQVGLLQVGPPQGEVISGVRASARTHGLEVENLTARAALARFPGFHLADSCEAIFERRAGYLLVESCVKTHAEEAVKLGAELHADQIARSWRVQRNRVIVETEIEASEADRLIIAGGPWAGSLLAGLNIPLEVRRKPLYWWKTASDIYRPERGCPGYLYELPHGVFYGFPQIDAAGIKVAEHTGGAAVRNPLAVNRGSDEGEERRVADFVRQYLPDATTERTDYTVCMYTMTPDEHFIVDRHPDYPQVAFAAGLSGHGFKFTPTLGEALCELVLDGRTKLPMEFLSLRRASLACGQPHAPA